MQLYTLPAQHLKINTTPVYRRSISGLVQDGVVFTKAKLAEMSSASDSYEAVPDTAPAATVGAHAENSGGSDDELVE